MDVTVKILFSFVQFRVFSVVLAVEFLEWCLDFEY